MWMIALKGFSGSGKSTLGRALSRQLGWPIIDKDDIKLLSEANYPINDPLLVVDTVRPLHEIIDEVIVWLDRHSGQSSLEDTTAREKEMTI